MIDLYRKSCYDYTYFREILPENLRYFKCYIIVSEFRQFHTLRSRAQEISTFNNVNTNRVNSTSPGDEEFKALNSMISSLTFEFDLCQFLFNESNSFLDDLNNRGEGDPIA